MSFINLKRTNTISDEQLHMICAGINEMTTDIEQQRIILDTVLENNINDFIKNLSSTKCLYEKSKEYAKKVLESQLKEAQQQVAATKEALEQKDIELDKIISNYQRELNEVKSELIAEKRKRYKELCNEIVKIDKRSKNIIIFWLAVIYIVVFTFIILGFNYHNENRNYVDYIVRIVLPMLGVGNALFFDNKLSLPIIRNFLINKLKNKLYKKNNIDLEEFEKLKNELENLTN